MENLQQQPNENNQVAKFDPALVYAGASSLMLTESEMKALSDPFEELEYEIRPDGFIYVPQALTLQRLNRVIGIGRWGLLLINASTEERDADISKVYYDGALMIRNCFVSRSIGESQFSKKNANTSKASALEAAKSDCRQRCCKDLGIATDSWNPSFIRKWQKDNAVRVFVDNNGKKSVAWRRKDVDAFWNETGLVPNVPTVVKAENKNQGPVSNEWKIKLAAVTTMSALTALYNDNSAIVDKWPELKLAFMTLRSKLQPEKKVA